MSDPDRQLTRRCYDAVIFDLDGVVTDTADAHRKAWKETFDEMLERQLGADFEPFTSRDYRRWVDGKPRLDGIRSFLESRALELPEGDPAEPPGLDSVQALGKEKNRRYHRYLDRGLIEVFDETVELIDRLEEADFRLAIVSSSRNARRVLRQTGLDERFETRVDGVTLAEQGLAGKPDPEMFLEAARRLGASPERCVVVEDAESGVEAGRAGQFGLVVGLAAGAEDRQRLLEAGADIAVATMAEFEVEGR